MNNETTATKLVSLGYRCSAAGILKRIGRKEESYPFDWLISRLPVVQHCIETEFRYFLDPQQYVQQQTITAHYDIYNNNNTIPVCDETIYYNKYYADFPISPMHTPSALKPPLDTYAYPMAMNHYNLGNSMTREYYGRCVGRFQSLLSNKDQPILFLYIHPALPLPEFCGHKPQLLHMCTEFAGFMKTHRPEGARTRTLFVFPVQTPCPYPITNRYPNVLETVVETATVIVKIMYANSDFVDAGEIFMRNPYIETDTLCDYIATLV